MNPLKELTISKRKSRPKAFMAKYDIHKCPSQSCNIQSAIQVKRSWRGIDGEMPLILMQKPHPFLSMRCREYFHFNIVDAFDAQGCCLGKLGRRRRSIQIRLRSPNLSKKLCSLIRAELL